MTKGALDAAPSATSASTRFAAAAASGLAAQWAGQSTPALARAMVALAARRLQGRHGHE